MKSRALRVALVMLSLGVTGAAAYVVWIEESQASMTARAARAFDDRLRQLTRSLLEVKSAQPGYVAAGQGEDFWASKVDAALETIRRELPALRTRATSMQAQTELEAVEAAFDDLQQVDRRAREYARQGQRLLASDLVFSEALEQIDTAVLALERARAGELAAANARLDQHRIYELIVIAGATALTLIVALLLSPLPRIESAAAAPASPSLDLPLAVPQPRSAAKPPASAPGPPAREQPKPAVVEAPARPAPPAAPAVDLPAVASVCTDLARVLDTAALPAVLERAAAVLDASGIVVWVADPDGAELVPVITHGYPQALVARMGSIPRDAENATAAAFRTGVLQTVKGQGGSTGAIAVPLITPAGPVGVMAAEVLHEGERKETTRATAAIVGAQLATLMGPPTPRAQGKAEAAGA